jgi:hypothetical protein
MVPEPGYVFGEAPTGGLQNGSITYNIKYNDRFLYPVDVKNSARHFLPWEAEVSLVDLVG